MNEAPQKKLASPQERLELVLLCLAKRVPVKRLCLEANVSRELCYRWLRAVRGAALKALEPKVPGPKRVKVDPSPAEVLKLQERVKRLEKELKGTRKDRDQWRLRAEVGRRIITRNAWGPIPEVPSKKNVMRSPRKGNVTCGSGSSNAAEGSGPGSLPGVGTSAGAPTGDGSQGNSRGPEPAQ